MLVCKYSNKYAISERENGYWNVYFRDYSGKWTLVFVAASIDGAFGYLKDRLGAKCELTLDDFEEDE